MKIIDQSKFDIYEVDKNECLKLSSEADKAMKNTYPKSNAGFAVA